MRSETAPIDGNKSSANEYPPNSSLQQEEMQITQSADTAALVSELEKSIEKHRKMLQGLCRMEQAASAPDGVQSSPNSQKQSQDMRNEISSKLAFLQRELAAVQSYQDFLMTNEDHRLIESTSSINLERDSNEWLSEEQDSAISFSGRSMNASRVMNHFRNNGSVLSAATDESMRLQTLQNFGLTINNPLQNARTQLSMTRKCVIFRLKRLVDGIKAEETLMKALRRISQSDLGSELVDQQKWSATDSAWQLYLSEQKIRLLNEQLAEYQSFLPVDLLLQHYCTNRIMVDSLSIGHSQHSLKDSNLSEIFLYVEPEARAMSGRLTVQVVEVNLSKETVMHNGPILVQLLGGGICTAPIKLKSQKAKRAWYSTETMELDLQHAHQMEILFFAKTAKPIAIISLPLGSLELSSNGQVPSSATESDAYNPLDTDQVNSRASSNVTSHADTPTKERFDNEEDDPVLCFAGTIDEVLDLIPHGTARLKLNFKSSVQPELDLAQYQTSDQEGSMIHGHSRISSTARPTQHMRGDSGMTSASIVSMQRHHAIRRREVRRLGHEFVPATKGTMLAKCAHCSDMIWGMTSSSVRMACRLCGYLCHRDCVDQIYVRCAADAVTFEHWQELTAFLMRHSQAHQLVPSNGRAAPTFCCHCGQMMSSSVLRALKGKRSSSNGESSKYFRCVECNCHIHNSCERFLPALCGLDRHQAIRLRDEFATSSILLDDNGRNQTSNANEAIGGSALEAILEEADHSLSFKDLSLTEPTIKYELEQFEILSVIGRGNFGKVLLARNKKDGMLVALKVLKKAAVMEDEDRESLIAEMSVFGLICKERAAAAHLVYCYGVFEDANRIYFVMEYVGGGDLMFHVQKLGRFNMEMARFFAAQVLLALEFLHRKDILYRDLKLDNLLITLSGHVKLADYGLCKLKMKKEDVTRTFCGTSEFMAPETLLDQPYTRAVDWWQFGVLLYELIYSRAPFNGRTEREIFRAILNNPLAFPQLSSSSDSKSLHSKAQYLIRQLLVKDPTKRLCDSIQIKKSTFFAGVDWDNMRHWTPPYVPALHAPADVSNFDQEFTSLPAQLTPSTSQSNSTVSKKDKKLLFDKEIMAFYHPQV